MHLVDLAEVGNEALTERAKHIADLFFNQGQGINVIMRELYPGVIGGEK